MLYGHAHEVALAVEVDVDVLADLLCLGNLVVGELDQGRVGI